MDLLARVPCEPPRDSSLVPLLYQQMAPGFSLTQSDHLLCALYGNPVNYFILVGACFTPSSMLYYGIKSTRYGHETMLKASASVSDHSGVVREKGNVLFATGIGDEPAPYKLTEFHNVRLDSVA